MRHGEPDWMADVEPGTIHLLVLDQDRWWVDTERTALDCMGTADESQAWLETTVFMQRLRLLTSEGGSVAASG